MSIKHIEINVFPPIQDVVKEMQTSQDTLIDVLSNRFRSEHNTGTLEYAQEALDGYCYVPRDNRLWVGRYVRYLDMTNAYNMNLKKGGFCVADNGYTVKIRNNNKTFNVSRRSRLWFMVINDTDVKQIQMNSLF